MTVVTSDNRYGTAQLIVAPTLSQGANYTTIASALAAAVSGQTIFIRPGTYTENITLVAGVNLAAYESDGIAGGTPNVIILGNTTASFNGSVSLTGIQLKTNSAACLTVSGSNASTLTLISCGIDGNNATAISMNAANFTIDIQNSKCQTESNNLLFAVTTGAIVFRTSKVQSGTAANTIAAGVINMFNSTFSEYSITTSSTGSFNAYNCFFTATNQTVFTLAGTGAAIIQNCSLFSGTASTVSIGSGTTVTMSLCAISSSNTNVITGAGTLVYSALTFTSSSSGINTTTKTGRYTQLSQFLASEQSAFNATLGTSVTNATGNNTTWVLGTTTALTEIFDQNNDFNTNGTYTAPVTGKVNLTLQIRTAASTGATSMAMNVVTSNRTYIRNTAIASQASQSFFMSVLADMDAADTATFSISLNGIGADTATISGGSEFTYVTGQITC